MLWVGTSGWQYSSWRERFYPRGLPQSRWLEHYSARFRTVEVNNTFYRLPPAETFARWARETPRDFVFVCKLSRYLTHVKRLVDPGPPARLFLERAAPLGRKRGPVLMQLPPNLAVDVARLREALAALSGVAVAVEFRHDSWYSDRVFSVLGDHGAALCLADRGSRPVTPLVGTSGWGYVRFHEGAGRRGPGYGDRALVAWVERIAELWGADAEVYAYFNNDPFACAVRDAVRFAELAERAGLWVTRVPAREEVRV